MYGKFKFITMGVIAFLTIAAIASVMKMNSTYDVIEDISEVKENAIELYNSGDTENAIEKMQIYCQYVTTDVEAKTVLGDWYMNTGSESDAYKCYYEAAKSKSMTDEVIPPLTVKNKEEIILEPLNHVVMEISADVRCTKDMTLMVTGHNIAPYERNAGKIEGYNEQLLYDENYLTTPWFKIDPDGEFLTMSGGFNMAIWQFKSESGVITHCAESPNEYRTKDSFDVNVYQMARANIPEKSAWCRVTYFNKTEADKSASNDEELTIVYGRLPGESEKTNCLIYQIPDLVEGEKIVYENNVWKMVTSEGESVLTNWGLPDIERGSYLMVGGVLPGRVSFENSKFPTFDKDGIYTIRFDVNNPSAVGERCDDARNLGFNAAVSEGEIALGENHFDNIYPWKDMKLCNIENGVVTAYENEREFSLDGENGDVFVEIPKFYVRRTADDNYDEISISGKCHEGFSVDDAFVTKDGERDKIYIAAYLTGKDEGGNAVSYTEINPVLGLSANELKLLSEEKGYAEVDYSAIMALQKLFMVETGLRNSQYLYMGSCAYTSADKANYPVALTSNTKTNCIVVSDLYRFEYKNSIIIFDNNGMNELRNVKTVIDNEDGTQSVYFDREPINVTEGVTGVAHVALKNGSTRGVRGHTGAMSTARGTEAFKYRGIENLWGNAYVYVDNITIKNKEAEIETASGEKYKISFDMPGGANGKVTDSMVKKIGYDMNKPGILLPSVVGEGATTSTYYGDTYFCENESDKEYILLYGGDWSSRECAGLFSYRADRTADDVNNNTAGRMMIR